MASSIDKNTSDALDSKDLDGVVGGAGDPNQPPPEDEVLPPPEDNGPMPPPEGDAPPPPPPEGDAPPPPLPGDEALPPPEDAGPQPPPDGSAPPPHPEGYVNGFIEPLYDGLTYVEGGTSTWTLSISPSSVDVANNNFVVTADQVGTWEGGIPPEATDNGDGTYTIHSWPITGMTDNGDGTVTLSVDIGPMVTA